MTDFQRLRRNVLQEIHDQFGTTPNALFLMKKWS